MKADERGSYMSMLLYLYQHKGRCPYDLDLIAGICNCRRNFARIWSKIEGKFVVKDNVLKHKAVTKKLREIKKAMQVQHTKALKGANARWHGHSPGNAQAMAIKTNTNQNQIIVNIDIGKGAREEVLALDSQIRVQAEDLCDHITRTFRPNPRSTKTLSHLVRFMVATVQADPDRISWLTEAKEWATVAHQDGKKDNGIPLFVATVKQKTGWRATPKLLKGAMDAKKGAECG